MSVMMTWSIIVELMTMGLNEDWVADCVVDINRVKQGRLVLRVLASRSVNGEFHHFMCFPIIFRLLFSRALVG